MPSYLKLKKNLDRQLQDKKNELINIIKERYNKVFDELEQYASDMHVERDVFAKRDITLAKKTNSNNFYALQANANNSSSLYENEMRKINDVALKGRLKSRIRKVVTLNTHTTEPMHTEADIDLYLQSLKVQLMKFLGEDNDIIVN